MSYFLWLDDYRVVNDAFRYLARDCELISVKDYAGFVGTVQAFGCPQAISFDHDLADDHYRGDFSTEMTGYSCAQWFGEWLLDDPARLIDGFRFYIHSMNPVGAANIEGYMINMLAEIRHRKA